MRNGTACSAMRWRRVPARSGRFEANFAYLAQPKLQTVRTAAGGSDLHLLLDAAGFGLVQHRSPIGLGGQDEAGVAVYRWQVDGDLPSP
jgi:hypothetical protein